jgi:hypothetical protein
MKRPTSITVLAWLLIVTSGFGAMFNIYGLVASIPPYPQWVWAALLLIKCGILLSGLLLLRMRRLAVWIYLGAAVAGWALSLSTTRAYTPVPAWQYAAGLVVFAIYAFIVIRHWDKLLPSRVPTRHSSSGAEAAE